VNRFESADGIKRDETITNKQITPEASGVVARGSYSYTGDDGKVYTVTWVADENGFQPSGAHLPVA
jgi:Insect cuticle protein